MPHITHFVANGAIRSAYVQSGRGFPFVLVHGYTGSKLDFQDQLEDFADQRTVIAADHRGHGESSNQGPYTLEQLTQDLLQFLDLLQIERCDLLGHSMGGMVAQQAVRAAPTRIRSLVLMDTSARPLRLLSDDVANELAEIVRTEGCTGLLPLMRLGKPGKAVQRGIDHLGEEEHWRRVRWKLAQLDPQAFIELRHALNAPIITDAALAAIDCPTTVIVGEQDLAFRSPATHLAGSIPNATLRIIEYAAHSPQYENHQDWRAAVRTHLENVALC